MQVGGKIDPRFNVIAVMQEFGWDYPQYLARPNWFDPYYEVKLKADAKYQEIKNKPTDE